jgi:RNA polymerase sigma factor (sigma-70 family)
MEDFGALYDRHHRAILSFCRHMLGSREEAEEVVRATFAAARTALAASDEPFAVRPWLYAIAYQRCLAVLRVRAERAARDPFAVPPPPSAAGLAPEVARRDDLRALQKGLTLLPDDERAALLLDTAGDLSDAEIARVLGIEQERLTPLVRLAREELVGARRPLGPACVAARTALTSRPEVRPSRAHLRACPRCRGYREGIRRQRAALAFLLPVVPGVRLREAVTGEAGPAAPVAAASGRAGRRPRRSLPASLRFRRPSKLLLGALLGAVAVVAAVIGIGVLSSGAAAPSVDRRPATEAAAPAPARAARKPAPAQQPAARPRRRTHHHRRHHASASPASSPAPAPAPAPAVTPAPTPVRTFKPVKKREKKQSKPKSISTPTSTKKPAGTTKKPATVEQAPSKPKPVTSSPPSTSVPSSNEGGAVAPPGTSGKKGTSGKGGSGSAGKGGGSDRGASD